jgi:hypothetical protein
MSYVTPEAMMIAGNAVLAEVLEPAGFTVGPIHIGKGSGGNFAVARWIRADQSLELHARYALGIVRYGWGDEVFDHRHIVGVLGVSPSYPGFSDDPVDGFRHLMDDLRGPLADFVGPNNRNILVAARRWHPPQRVLP